MKNSLVFAVLVLLLITLPGSCKKSEETLESITTEEYADMVAYDLSKSSAGMVVFLEDAATLASETAGMLKSSAAVMADSSFTITSPSGSSVAYSYTVHYSFGFEVMQQQFNFDYNSAGSFDAPRASASDTTDASLAIEGVGGSEDLVVNGNCIRNGTFTSKILNKRSYTTRINFSLINVGISPDDLLISGGKVNLAITGQDNTGRGFTGNGELTFLGNHRAELVINSYTYLIDLNTGTVDPE